MSQNKFNMNGKTLKYLYYEKNKQSLINIPVSIAKALRWNPNDDIEAIFENIEGKKGLFLYKKSDNKKDLILED